MAEKRELSWEEDELTVEAVAAPRSPTGLRHMALLTQVAGEGAPREVTVPGGRVRIGRGPEAELHIPDGSVSSLHAQIELTPAGYQIRDLGSTHGILLNGVRVHAAVLHKGDQIQLGAALLVFEESHTPV